ncbi:hypothetical protein [Heyndrickxia ginsengihumi]|uniref:hypothetical protein n=1 Tax=Heyndrickxia ginsengihumi TaxID=363870 RepID=UPI00046FBDED|nr:hypothetical protein [Heyndrickxia ginsengihumi]
MTRTTFSEHDLIGVEIKKNQHQVKESVFFRILDILIPEPKTKDFSLNLPTTLFIKAIALSDFINEEYDLDDCEFKIGSLIWILYKDFLGRAYKYNNLNELYSFISSMEHNHVGISDYRNKNGSVNIHSNDQFGETTITISLSTKEALKGELVLADLYETFSYHITLEKLIELQVVHFLNEYKKGHLPNAVNEIVNYYKKSSDIE